jgi:hypothetical protein
MASWCQSLFVILISDAGLSSVEELPHAGGGDIAVERCQIF